MKTNLGKWKLQNKTQKHVCVAQLHSVCIYKMKISTYWATTYIDNRNSISKTLNQKYIFKKLFNN